MWMGNRIFNNRNKKHKNECRDLWELLFSKSIQITNLER